MANKLQETRSLINMARRLGQEPAPELLEQLTRLETEANRKLQLESRIKNRVAQDVVKMFNPNHPVPAAITIPASKPAPVVQLQEQMAVVQPIEIKDVAAQVADSIQRQVRNEGTLVRPDAQMPADTAALDQKVKYLENWISRIAATGPGGGEVNLRYLDDVARSTIADGRFLRYNAGLKKFDFSTVTLPDVISVSSVTVSGNFTVLNASTSNSLIFGDNTDFIRIGGDQYVQDGNAFALMNGVVQVGTGGQNVDIGTGSSEAYNTATTTFRGAIEFGYAESINFNSFGTITWGTPSINLVNCTGYSYTNLDNRPKAANEPYTTLAYAATVTPTANTNVRVTCTGNLIINAPAATADGTMVRMWIIASGSSRTVSLQATIRIPNTSTFTSPQTIAMGEKARLAIQYDSVRAVWELVSFVNGY